jgi:hypothetical protein
VAQPAPAPAAAEIAKQHRENFPRPQGGRCG